MRFALAVCAIFKDEAAYLREWLDFHLLMGVEHFYLYDNGSSDQSGEAVAPYVARGQVTLYAWPQRPGQLEAYNHCVFTHREDCDWLACIDIDEFLFSPQSRPLPEVLEAYAAHPAVGVNWVMFGSAGHRQAPEGGVLINYRRRGELEVQLPYPNLRRPDGQGFRPENSHIKSIVRPACVKQFTNPHFAHYVEDRLAVCERGMSLNGPFSDTVSVEVLRINHYWSKSEEEARRKFARGFADGQGARQWQEFEMHEKAHNTVADDRILQVAVARSAASEPRQAAELQRWPSGVWRLDAPAPDADADADAGDGPVPEAAERRPGHGPEAAATLAVLDLAGPPMAPGGRVLLLGRALEPLIQAWAGQGLALDVLEHEGRQAGLLARHCAPLPSVRVLQAGLQELQFEPVYDAVVLLGLPDYAATLGLDGAGLASALKRLEPALRPQGRLLLWTGNGLRMAGGAPEEDLRRGNRHGLREGYGRRELQQLVCAAGLVPVSTYALYGPGAEACELAVHEACFESHPQMVFELLAGSRRAGLLGLRDYLQLEDLSREVALAGRADAYLLTAVRGEPRADEPPVLWRRLTDSPWPGLRRLEEARRREDGNGLEIHSRRLLQAVEPPTLMGRAVSADLSRRPCLVGRGSLLVALRQAAAARQLDRLQALLRAWVQTLRSAVDAHGKLPGEWLDAVPARMQGDADAGWSYTGGHWTYAGLIEPDLPLYLGLWSLVDDPLVAGMLKGSDRVKLMLWLCTQSGLEPTEKWLAATAKIHALLSPDAPADGGPSAADLAAQLKKPAAPKPLSYQQQLDLRVLDEAMVARAHAAILGQTEALPELIVVVLAFGSTPPQLLLSLKGLQHSQYQGPVQLVIVSDRGAPVAHERIHWLTVPEGSWHKPLQQWLAGREEDWLVFVHAGDRLEPSALVLLAERIAAQPALRAVYFDEDHLQAPDCKDPVLKPDFNLDMLRSYPYIGRGIALHRQTCVEVGGLQAAYADVSAHDALLRIYEACGAAAIGHIPELQYHASLAFPQWLIQPGVLGVWPAVVEAHLRRLKIPHRLLPGALAGMNRVCYDYPEQPLVSIIIPTRDQLHLLNGLIDSLMQRTAYAQYELLIVDNNSQEPAACRYLDGLERLGSSRVRVLRYPHSFNYSAMNNMAAREARGEYLLLLNNDTAVLHAEWLDAMVNHARRPEVGIVGAKLHYPDGRIQHAGVVLGLRGIAEHPFIGDPEKAGGYMHRLQVDQNYSAVTAACLLIRKSIFDSVGGLDEKAFKVCYNDVDLCLKVREAGHLIVWTPYARLMHHGSVSQNQLDKPQAEAKRLRFQGEREAMEVRWLPQLARDPAYNLNFALMAGSFELDNSRGKSWQPFSRPLLPRIICHPADATGCGHYRVRQPFASMLREGLVEGQVSEQLFHLVALQRNQVQSLVLQRQHTDPQRAAMKAYRRLPDTFMVYELDDYMLNLPVKSAHRQQMPKDLRKSLRAAVALVDRFVVSTECLAEELGYMHSDMRVVHNRLPVDWWTGLTAQRRTGPRPRVGWGGGASHTGDLELIGDVIRELADEVDWVFFGMCPDKLRPYIKEFHGGVPIEQYPAKLASMNLDLALAPLEDNLFNACKSNLRLLEYGACGFPVVCSDLVTYRDALPVTRVKNRFKDWVGAIRMHIHDLDATAAAGDRLREAVLKDWMLTGEHLQTWRQAWLP